MKKEIPQNLQGILWSASVSKLDLERDKNYIIHQILTYGSLGQIHWLFKIYGEKTLKEVFIHKPYGIYTPQSFNFTKNIILNLRDIPLDKNQYVKSIY